MTGVTSWVGLIVGVVIVGGVLLFGYVLVMWWLIARAWEPVEALARQIDDEQRARAAGDLYLDWLECSEVWGDSPTDRGGLGS